jgi:hypothetical protein
MADPKNNTIQARGTDLSPEQLSHASNFLALVGWKENEYTRTTARVDIARLIAWYGSLRYQAGCNGSGSLERPLRLITPTPVVSKSPRSDAAFEITDFTEIVFRPLESD